MASRIGCEGLLLLVEESYDKPAWYGPNLRGALRRVTAPRATWRPGKGRHSIWDLALHCAYWEHVAVRQLVGAPRGAFPRKPSNFPSMPSPATAGAWKRDLQLLDETHARLLGAVRETLRSVRPGTVAGRRALRVVRGVAGHNTYHAGQIRLLIRLSGATGS